MLNTKLIRLISSLSLSERQQMHEFLAIKAGENQKHVRKIYSVLSEHFDINGLPFSKQYLWMRCFGNKEYRDDVFRKYCSDLAKLTEEFLAFNAFQKAGTDKLEYLLSELDSRGLDKEFMQTLKLAQRMQSETGDKDTAHYHSQYQLSDKLNRFMSKQGQRTQETNLQEAAESLDHYYLINKLKYYCELLNAKKVLELDDKMLLMDEILAHLEINDYSHIPAIAIYYNILQLLKHPADNKAYKNLRAHLQEHATGFGEEELTEMYTYAINNTIGRINRGDNSYLKELFYLYTEALDKGLLLERGRMTPWSYKNITFVGLRLGEFGWVEDFITKFKGKLDKDQRENAHTFNMARLHFFKQNYDEVISLLQQVDYDDVFYSLDSRSILLKTYYELDEVEALYSLIDSFRISLRRNRVISDEHRKNYLNLIRFVKRAAQLSPGNSQKLDKLKTDVENTPQIADVGWLREKLEGLV